LKQTTREETMRRNWIFGFLFAAGLANLSNAQNILIPNADTLSVQQRKPFGISANLGGPTLAASISAIYYLHHYLKAEVGGGLLGYFAGATLHYRNDHFNDNWTAYAGIYYSQTAVIFGNTDHESGIYCPIGMQFVNNKGFGFAPEIAYRVSPELHHTIWAALKFSYQL
jgi:hypothetical protein